MSLNNWVVRPIRKIRQDTKRNAPCPCGSGKKFKNCCLDKRTENFLREKNTPVKEIDAKTPN